MEKTNLKVDFVSFWPNFIKNDNYFYNLLDSKYNVSIDSKNPDIVFHSYDYSGKKEHEIYDNEKTLKIFYSGENTSPDFNDSHYAFTYSESTDDKKNYRLPLWVLHINWFNKKYLKKRDIAYHIDVNSLTINKNKKMNKQFCSFVATHSKGKRVQFVPKLNEIERVDCGGKLFNNINKTIKGRGDQHWKYNFLKNYKFNIAFENEIGNGYVSEKIIQPMSVSSIPIYWGSEMAKLDFNESSFIFVDDFESEEKLIEYIIKLNNNEDLYNQKLNEPWFRDNKVPEAFLPELILEHFDKNILTNLK